jgi:hypothetical protein
MMFSLVSARSTLAGFERLNREVYILLYFISLGDLKKGGKVVGDVT